MGKTMVSIGQTDSTITRSIMRDTVKTLVMQTGFDTDADVIFDDESVDSPRQIKNIFDGCFDKGIRTQYKSYVFVEYTDKMTEEGGWVNSMRGNDQTPPLFNDPAIGVRVTPRYVEHEANMTIRFRSNSKVKLNQWINALKATDSIKTHLGYVDVRYDYSFPYSFLDFIYDAWKMMDKHPSPTPDLKEYLTEHMRHDIQSRKNLNGTHSEVIAVERQMNVEGIADDKLFYETRQIQRGIYEVVLEYRFTYKRIVAAEMVFPALIYNEFIDAEYVHYFHTNSRLRNDSLYTKPISFIGNKLQNTEIDYYYMGDGGSRMVPWDDFFPTKPNENIQTVSLFPIKIDDDNPEKLFHIDDLTDDFMPSSVYNYIMQEKDHINKFNQSLVEVELYAIDEEERRIPVFMDADNNFVVNEDLDSRRRHYCRIGLKKDIPSIHPESLKRILNQKDLAIDLFELYDDGLEVTIDADEWQKRVGKIDRPGTDKSIPSLLLVVGDKITDYSFTRWVRKLKGTNEWFKNLRPTMPKYVGQYNISVRR